jgi:hypothetical protein
MKTFILVALSVGILAGCDRVAVSKDPPGQWILESYDSEKGYVFRKDGVRYQAHCNAVVWTKASGDWNINEEVSEGDCATVLPFLHKTLSLAPGGKPDIVHFDKYDPEIKWTYAFKITEAK